MFKSFSPNDKLRDAVERLKILLNAETSFVVAQISKRAVKMQEIVSQSQAGMERIEQVLDVSLPPIQEAFMRLQHPCDNLRLHAPEGTIVILDTYPS